MFVKTKHTIMKLIKNISPTGIKVHISVISDGQSMSVELSHGESILVHDNSIATKSIIIQKRKGNIDILDEFPDEMIPYVKYYGIMTNDEIKTLAETIVFENPEIILTVPTLASVDCGEIKSEITSTLPIKNKGGRPKGSFKKKKSKKKKVNKTDSSEKIITNDIA
jgi:hypothetical protein